MLWQGWRWLQKHMQAAVLHSLLRHLSVRSRSVLETLTHFLKILKKRSCLILETPILEKLSQLHL